MIIDANFVLTIIIQVVSVFTFLCIFFFTYVRKQEKIIFDRQINFLIDNISQHNLNLLPNNEKRILKNSIGNINSNTPEINKTNQDINNNNKDVIDKTKKILLRLVIFLTFVILTSIYLSKNSNISFFNNFKVVPILKESLIILVFIAITEFIFLKLFISEYISVEPNILKAKFFKNIANAIN